jgi:adenine phosphoribosyltransferase
MPNYLHLINTDTEGPRCDVTPLFADADAFSQLIQELAVPLAKLDFELVAGIDALGFILGTALACHFQTGFLAVRKGGKLPVKTDRATFVDYTGQQKSLELQRDAIQAGTKILLADEWIETGAQIQAAIRLIERQGGEIAGIVTISMDDNETTHAIKKLYPCFTA